MQVGFFEVSQQGGQNRPQLTDLAFFFSLKENFYFKSLYFEIIGTYYGQVTCYVEIYDFASIFYIYILRLL